MKNLKAPEIVVISPGRVNLLGEHVDYNDGMVLPIAIDKAITINSWRISEQIIKLSAADLDESVEMSLASLRDKKDINGKDLPNWARYPAGVARVLEKYGFSLAGVDAEFHSDLPIGAGLSSSAALEVGFAVLWQTLGGWPLDRMTLARYCQEAEVSYVGVNCGLMDQFASANGVAGHALYLDTRTLLWRPVPIPEGLSVVIADSMVRHKLTDSAYNLRHQECDEAVRILKQQYPGISALRDVSLDMLNPMQEQMPGNVFRRARHIVSECLRVQKAVVLLDEGDGVGFGKLMFQTHSSLRDDFEVSCQELDILVDSAANIPGCLGARLTGAGFGGCTVNIVADEGLGNFIEKLNGEYRKKTGIDAAIFSCHAENGAHVAINNEKGGE